MIISFSRLCLVLLNTPVDYTWQDGSHTPFYTITAAGIYSLTALNECGAFTDSVTITMGICDITMPSAFTPNRDGLNDVFRVKYPFPVKQFNFNIYNRWGQKILKLNCFT